MLGIECKFECPSCGALIRVNSPFWDKKTRKDIAEPTKCSCGRKESFKLVDFKPCRYEVVPEGFILIREDKPTETTPA